MEYRLIQQPSTKVDLFNQEINDLLKDNWELHGETRIVTLESTDTKLGSITYVQILQKDDEKPALGFNSKR